MPCGVLINRTFPRPPEEAAREPPTQEIHLTGSTPNGQEEEVQDGATFMVDDVMGNPVRNAQQGIRDTTTVVRRSTRRRSVRGAMSRSHRVIDRNLTCVASEETPIEDPGLGDYLSGFLQATHPVSTTTTREMEEDPDLGSVHATAPEVEQYSSTTPHGADDHDEMPPFLGKPIRAPFYARGTEIRAVDMAMARLYDLCDRAGCPRKMGDRIIDVMKEEMMEHGFKLDDPKLTRRNATIDRLQKVTGIPYPESIPITLESGRHVTIYRFPFQESLQRHLLSYPYSRVENLHIEKEDPWQGLCNYPNNVTEIHDGAWYKETMHQFQEKYGEGRYLVHPLLLYIDKTGTDKIEKNSLEPLMATSTILKSKDREQSQNWFPIGLMPSTSTKSSADKRLEKGKQSTQSLSVREYHHCLEVLLEPLKELQRTKPCMTFRRGDYVCKYHIVSPVAGVVGDNLAADLLCGRRGNRTRTTPRMSRRCLTPFDKTDAICHTCNAIREDFIHKLGCGALGCEYGHPGDINNSQYPVIPSIQQSLNFEQWRRHLRSLTTTSRKLHESFLIHRKNICREVLSKVFCAHAIYNGFTGIDFGATMGGIHRSTLSDVLHTVEEGIIPKLLEVFFGRMAPKQLSRVDALVQCLFGERSNRSGERCNYPRVSFTRGYSRLTLLSADERVGQLFVLSLLLRMRAGKEVLSSRFETDFDAKRDAMSKKLAGGQKKRKRTDHSTLLYNEAEELPGVEVEDSDIESTSTGEEQQVPHTTQELDDRSMHNILRAMDLSYIWTAIRPSLANEHQTILRNTLQATMKATWKDRVSNLTVPPGYMDYHKSSSDANPLSATRAPHRTSTPIPRPNRVTIDANREACSIPLNISQFTFLCELIMAFHSLLKYGNHRLAGMSEEQKKYQESLALMKELLTRGVNRGEDTMGWNLQKFLELSHFLDDIVQFGRSGGYSTSTGERGLKAWAKKPAKTAQKRSTEIFSKQVCLRIHEASIIAASLPKVEPLDTGRVEEDGVELLRMSTGKNFLYARDEDDGPQGHVWQVKPNGRRIQRVVDYPQVICWWFDRHIPSDQAREGVRLHTELSIFEFDTETQEKTKLIVRAHHNYQHSGPWNDFALVKYERVGTYPARVACFYEDPGTTNLCALVQECTTEEALESDSLITSMWRLASYRNGDKRWPKLKSVSADTLSDRIYAIETDNKGLGFRHLDENFDFLWVKFCREEWPQNFLSAHAEYQDS